jgi:hypothetical protein
VSSLVNRAILVLREIVNDPSTNTLGINLDIGVQLGNVSGQGNKISFIASHAPVDVSRVTRAGVISLVVPPFTERSDIYYSNYAINDNWKYLGSTTGSSFTVASLPVNARVIAIGRSSLIPGLESFPGAFNNAPDPGGGTRR